MRCIVVVNKIDVARPKGGPGNEKWNANKKCTNNNKGADNGDKYMLSIRSYKLGRRTKEKKEKQLGKYMRNFGIS